MGQNNKMRLIQFQTCNFQISKCKAFIKIQLYFHIKTNTICRVMTAARTTVLLDCDELT